MSFTLILNVLLLLSSCAVGGPHLHLSKGSFCFFFIAEALPNHASNAWFCLYNKHPPAKRVVLLMRAKPFVPRRRVKRVIRSASCVGRYAHDSCTSLFVPSRLILVLPHALPCIILYHSLSFFLSTPLFAIPLHMR